MKTIKIIDLLNKIANGEEVPEKIKYGNAIYEKLNMNNYRMITGYELLFDDYFFEHCNLNDEVEILDEEDEFEDIRELGIPEIDTVENERICRAEYKINALIKNQKKIIERLRDEKRT